MGNIGYEAPACQTGLYLSNSTTANVTDFSGQVELKCAQGDLDQIMTFGQVSKNDYLNCNELKNAPKIHEKVAFYPSTCEYSKWNQTEMTLISNNFMQQCQGKSSCTFQYKQS